MGATGTCSTQGGRSKELEQLEASGEVELLLGSSSDSRETAGRRANARARVMTRRASQTPPKPPKIQNGSKKVLVPTAPPPMQEIGTATYRSSMQNELKTLSEQVTSSAPSIPARTFK
eukprot:3416502-Amphidinium_carterae.1